MRKSTKLKIFRRKKRSVILSVLKRHSLRQHTDLRDGRAAVFEVKYAKRLTDLEQECEKAVMQIDDRMYAKTLEDRYDQVSCFGIAFYKKRCLIQKK